MDIHVWILSFLMIFMLHNLEEIIMIERWFQKIYPRVKDRIPLSFQGQLQSFQNTTSVQFSIVVFSLSILVSVAIFISVLTEHYYLFLGICLIFALNIFTHPLQSLLLRCYTPGVITSLLLVIPYYSLFFYHFYGSELFTTNSVLGAAVVIVLFIPTFIFCHKIGEKWK